MATLRYPILGSTPGTTVTSTSAPNFTGLTGNSVSGYTVLFHVKVSTASTLLCRINADGGSTYPHGIMGSSFAAATVVTQNSTDRTAIPLSPDLTEGGFMHGFIKFTNTPSGVFRGYCSESFTYNQTSSVVVHSTCGGSWLNTADEITAINFVFSGTVTEFRGHLYEHR